jgi:hypothetical protein
MKEVRSLLFQQYIFIEVYRLLRDYLSYWIPQDLPAQFFGDAHRSRVCVYIFIGASVHLDLCTSALYYV